MIINNIKGTIEDFPESIIKLAATPASDHLFQVRLDTEQNLFPEYQAQQFIGLGYNLSYSSPEPGVTSRLKWNL